MRLLHLRQQPYARSHAADAGKVPSGVQRSAAPGMRSRWLVALARWPGCVRWRGVLPSRRRAWGEVFCLAVVGFAPGSCRGFALQWVRLFDDALAGHCAGDPLDCFHMLCERGRADDQRTCGGKQFGERSAKAALECALAAAPGADLRERELDMLCSYPDVGRDFFTSSQRLRRAKALAMAPVGSGCTGGFRLATLPFLGSCRNGYPGHFRSVRQVVGKSHAQGDPLARQVDLENLDLDHVAGLDHAARVLDEAVGDRRDMYQSVLMDTDVDKGAEVGDIGHHSFENHSHLQILDGLDAFTEVGGAELWTRVSTGFFEFPEDVADRRQAELLVDELLRQQCPEQLRVADDFANSLDDFANSLPDLGEDTLDERVGFRMHRRAVERVVAFVDAQEAGRQLEGLVAEAGYCPERLPIGKGTMLVAVGDDVRGQRRAESGDARQQRRRGGVDVDTDRVHAVLDDRIERSCQPGLADIMLVLSDTDRFRIDLDQFGERILQAAGDRHRTA